jgi:hypothetical protein
MTNIDAQLLDALPVHVKGVEVQDPVLTLFGEEWSLTIACPWQGEVGGRPISWEDADLEDRVWDLVGAELVSVKQEGAAARFGFSAGTLLVTPDTDLDPWVLRLPGGLLVGRR